jgi:hypothetical protein
MQQHVIVFKIVATICNLSKKKPNNSSCETQAGPTGRRFGDLEILGEEDQGML